MICNEMNKLEYFVPNACYKCSIDPLQSKNIEFVFTLSVNGYRICGHVTKSKQHKLVLNKYYIFKFRRLKIGNSDSSS